jgi:hypothetical protein
MTIDLFLSDSANLVPRDRVRIENMTATPAGQGRVKIEIALTPFRERPNLEILLRDATGRLVSQASAVAIMHFRVAFFLHLRNPGRQDGEYVAQGHLYYDDAQTPQDTRETAFNIRADEPDGS